MEVNAGLSKLFDYYKSNEIAHAYLITTNNVDKCVNELFCILKKIYLYDQVNNEEQKKIIDNLIDKRLFPNIILIEPDGTKIKKEQIANLKHAFAMTSQLATLKVYIIKNAEKMNKEATNSILKFLEDPYQDTIGFFVTPEKNNILDTIISRCENICVNYDLNGISIQNFDLVEIIDNYLNEIELNNNRSILINQEIVLSKIKERKDIVEFIKTIFHIYNEALRMKLSKTNQLDEKYEFIYEQNINRLHKKNDLLKDLLKQLNYNINIELLLDRFVIEVGEINNENLRSSI